MPKSQVPKRSSIWIYFNEHSRDLGKCSICGTIISTRGGSTSNLRRHIKAKHRKIALEKMNRLKLIAKGKEEEEEEENLFIQNAPEEEVEECSGEKFHSEVVFHDYAAMEQVEVEIDEEGNTEPAIIVEERRAPVRKPNILQRYVTSSGNTNNTGNSDIIRKMNNQLVLSDKSNRKAEALEQIAYNLGRLATVFEKMSGIICSLNQQHDENEECASEEAGVKADGLIMNVLSDGDQNF